VQQAQDALLQVRLQIYEQVAARADIELGERRVLQEVLRSEGDQVADLFFTR
jgi:hypothetical protein